MGSIQLHQDAKRDIKDLLLLDDLNTKRLLVLLQEFGKDPLKFANLRLHGYGEFRVDDFNVKQWRKAQQTGRDLWRVKDLSLERVGVLYRVVYCFKVDANVAHILAVVRKNELNYDDLDDDLCRRIMRAYDSL